VRDRGLDPNERQAKPRRDPAAMEKLKQNKSDFRPASSLRLDTREDSPLHRRTEEENATESESTGAEENELQPWTEGSD
jgi:hypothetical protein